MAHLSKYPPELLRRAIGELIDRGRKIPEAAKELGSGSAERLRNWVKQARRDAGLEIGPTTEELADICRLRREVADQQRTIEILKAARHRPPGRDPPGCGRPTTGSTGPIDQADLDHKTVSTALDLEVIRRAPDFSAFHLNDPRYAATVAAYFDNPLPVSSLETLIGHHRQPVDRGGGDDYDRDYPNADRHHALAVSTVPITVWR